MKARPHPQWKDSGDYKEPIDSDPIRVSKLEIDGATTYLDKDGSNNMTFTDAVTGTKTLAELGGAVSEINLTPKTSSSGPEGTIFYNSNDDHVYVGTEA